MATLVYKWPHTSSCFPARSRAIREALADTPVVCIAGARQSGKTTLARQLEPARPLYTLDDAGYYRTAQLDPDGFVAGLPEFVTIDEVQRAPDLLRGDQDLRGPEPSVPAAGASC